MAAGAGMIAGAIWGAYNQALSNRTQWKYLQSTSREVRRQADQVRAIGASEIRMFHRQAEYRLGSIEATFGHSGVAADSGSAFETLMAQAGVDALSKLQTQRSTDIQARNLDVTAAFIDHQRKILDRQLGIQMINGAIQGASGGASQGFGANFATSSQAGAGVIG